MYTDPQEKYKTIKWKRKKKNMFIAPKELQIFKMISIYIDSVVHPLSS